MLENLIKQKVDLFMYENFLTFIYLECYIMFDLSSGFTSVRPN